MWQVCFAVFVIPTAIFTALGLLELLIYGGEGDDGEDRAARIVHRLLSPQRSWEQFERIPVSQQRPGWNRAAVGAVYAGWIASAEKLLTCAWFFAILELLHDKTRGEKPYRETRLPPRTGFRAYWSAKEEVTLPCSSWGRSHGAVRAKPLDSQCCWKNAANYEYLLLGASRTR